MVFVAFLILACTISAVAGARTTLKGVVHVGPDFMCDDFNTLSDMDMWYDYTCGLNYLFHDYDQNCSIPVNDGKFVPMMFGNGWGLKSLIGPLNYALAFNEPNHQSQSNMSAHAAVDVWGTVKNLAGNRTLVCPSPARCGENCITTTAEEWFSEFLPLCEAAHGSCCDILATHTYMCVAADVIEELEKLYNLFGKPIWLTEFACARTTEPYTQQIFMRQLLPKLENKSYVDGYMWFKARMDAAGMSGSEYVTASVSLFEQDSSELTALGQYYQGYNGGNDTVTLDEISAHDFNEVPTPLFNFAGVHHGEAMIVLEEYTAKHCDWWRPLSGLVNNLQAIASSAQAYHLVATKAQRKTRIQTFFTKLVCATQSERDLVNDGLVWAEVDRIKALDETAIKKGRLKYPVC